MSGSITSEVREMCSSIDCIKTFVHSFIHSFLVSNPKLKKTQSLLSRKVAEVVEA